MKIEIDFNNFMECEEAGRFIINKYWLEYLLNLFYQEYYGEVWEEITDTKIHFCDMIETMGYGIIGQNFKEIKNAH